MVPLKAKRLRGEPRSNPCSPFFCAAMASKCTARRSLVRMPARVSLAMAMSTSLFWAKSFDAFAELNYDCRRAFVATFAAYAGAIRRLERLNPKRSRADSCLWRFPCSDANRPERQTCPGDWNSILSWGCGGWPDVISSSLRVRDNERAGATRRDRPSWLCPTSVNPRSQPRPERIVDDGLLNRTVHIGFYLRVPRVSHLL